MNITLDQIKSLRERTGISTTACKKALEEANGNEDLAIEILRKKGAAKAAERSDRATAQGVVALAGTGSKVAMLALGCETDFVSKNEGFVAKTQALADRLLAEGEDADFSGELNDLNIQMGEKVEIVDKKVVEAPVVGTYIHSNRRIGVAVALDGGSQEVAQDIAMHIAALKPLNVSPDEVSQELLDKEKVIWAEQLAAEGKPAEIVEKIMFGKEKKFREESALLTQAFVKNPEQQIQDLLGGSKIQAFWRFEV
jgi:elongation factor Ts